MEIPSLKNEAYWASVDSKQVKDFAIGLIVETLKGVSTEDMTDAQCRSVLSRLQGHIYFINPTELSDNN